MHRPSLRCILFLLLLASILVTPWVGAAELRLKASSHHTTTLLVPLSVLDQMWVFVSGFWDKEGCVIDPDGLHATGGTGSGEAGCILDPNGLCTAATPVQGEAGCILDPSGLCVR